MCSWRGSNRSSSSSSSSSRCHQRSKQQAAAAAAAAVAAAAVARAAGVMNVRFLALHACGQSVPVRSRAAEPPYMCRCAFMNHPCMRSAPRNSPHSERQSIPVLPHAADQAFHLFIHCHFRTSPTQLSSFILIVLAPSFPFIFPLFPCHCIAKLARSAVTHLLVHACKWGHRLSQPNAVAPVLPHAAGTPCAQSLSFPCIVIAATPTIAIATAATSTYYHHLLLPSLPHH